MSDFHIMVHWFQAAAALVAAVLWSKSAAIKVPNAETLIATRRSPEQSTHLRAHRVCCLNVGFFSGQGVSFGGCCPGIWGPTLEGT
jgi:hypothetical protein